MKSRNLLSKVIEEKIVINRLDSQEKKDFANFDRKIHKPGNVYAKKSQRLKSRQKGMDVNIIAYADKATERLKKKYQKLIERNVPRNKAIVAVARELACFILGTETGNIH